MEKWRRLSSEKMQVAKQMINVSVTFSSLSGCLNIGHKTCIFVEVKE